MNENNDFPELELDDPSGEAPHGICHECNGPAEQVAEYGNLIVWECIVCGIRWESWTEEL